MSRTYRAVVMIQVEDEETQESVETLLLEGCQDMECMDGVISVAFSNVQVRDD